MAIIAPEGSALSVAVIGVADLETSLRFYRDIIGLSPRPAVTWSGPDFERHWRLPPGASAQAVPRRRDLLRRAAARPAVFNLGNGKGYSVREVIQAAESVTGRPVPARVAPRRPGDPPVLLASAEAAQRDLGWQPRFPELEVILAHAWAWHQKLHGGLA